MKLSRILTLLAAFLSLISPFAFSQQPSLPPEKNAVVYGENIQYFEAGQGPAVILLHGLGAVKEIWMANLDALAAKYHVYAIASDRLRALR
jgi:hypothetical protein